MRKMLIGAIFAAALAACGQAAQPGATGQVGSTTMPAASPAATAAQPTAAPEPTGAPAPSAEPQQPGAAAGTVTPDGVSGAPADLVETATRRLAAYLKVKPDELVLRSATPQEWPDGAIGCPQEGMVYPQVIVEGYLLVFTNPAGSEMYNVHTARGPEQMILCRDDGAIDLTSAENSAAAAPRATPAAGEVAPAALDVAKAALAQDAGVKVEDIAIVAAEPVQWNNSSLGCPKEGQAYMQVITPGYRITLEAQGQRYEYHTDAGKRAIRCDTPMVQP